MRTVHIYLVRVQFSSTGLKLYIAWREGLVNPAQAYKTLIEYYM